MKFNSFATHNSWAKFSIPDDLNGDDSDLAGVAPPGQLIFRWGYPIRQYPRETAHSAGVHSNASGKPVKKQAYLLMEGASPEYATD